MIPYAMLTIKYNYLYAFRNDVDIHRKKIIFHHMGLGMILYVNVWFNYIDQTTMNTRRPLKNTTIDKRILLHQAGAMYSETKAMC